MRQGGKTTAQLGRLASIFAASLGVATACLEDVDLGQFQQEAASAGAEAGGSIALGGAGNEAGASAGAPPADCKETSCFGKIYQCGDCIDNDGDGNPDAADSQCLGPCDNTEESFFGSISGSNNAPCKQDCYFDGDTGSGNDDCAWNQKCDPLSVPEDYPPSGDSQCAYDEAATIPGASMTCTELREAQSAMCGDICMPFVPNGCDCFGCCELPADSGAFVWIGSTNNGAGSCSEETLDDPSACRPCTPVPSCFNECGECEVCAGRPEPDPSCAGPDDNACGDGYQACGRPGQSPCSAGTYCITGCCITIPK
jgi:hypothetical protein